MLYDAVPLLWVVNLGCIDLNPCGARCDDVDRPDYSHFDLDPVPGASFELVRQTALITIGLQAAVRISELLARGSKCGGSVFRCFGSAFSKIFPRGAGNGNGVGKKDGIGNHDAATIFGRDDCSACLNVFDSTLQSSDRNQIPDSKGFLNEQQDPREEILKNILEGESNGHAADPEDFDQIGGLKGRRDDGKRYEEA